MSLSFVLSVVFGLAGTMDMLDYGDTPPNIGVAATSPCSMSLLCPSSLPMSSSLFFNDGNIILLSRTFVYKVHLSMLTALSGVFSTMVEIALPYPPAGLDDVGCDYVVFDGLPVVPLWDDPAMVDVFLQLMLNTGYVLMSLLRCCL